MIDHSPRLTAVAVACYRTFAVAGCGSTANPPGGTNAHLEQHHRDPGTAARRPPAASQHHRFVEIGNTVNYGSIGTTADLDCAGGKSLNVGGFRQHPDRQGHLRTACIGGADNKITFDTIDNLSVVGLNNTITYKDGDPEGRQPRLGQQDFQGLPAPAPCRPAPAANRAAPSNDSAATREMLPNSKSMASASDAPHWCIIDSRSDRMHCCGSLASSPASSSAAGVLGLWVRRDWPTRSPALRPPRRRVR